MSRSYPLFPGSVVADGLIEALRVPWHIVCKCDVGKAMVLFLSGLPHLEECHAIPDVDRDNASFRGYDALVSSCAKRLIVNVVPVRLELDGQVDRVSLSDECALIENQHGLLSILDFDESGDCSNRCVGKLVVVDP